MMDGKSRKKEGDDIKWVPMVFKETDAQRKKRMGKVYSDAMDIDAAHTHDAPLHTATL
jgi:hypothetical protein